MKKILLILLSTLISTIVFSQIDVTPVGSGAPVKQQFGSIHTKTDINGMGYAKAGWLISRYADTASANAHPWIKNYPGVAIIVNDTLYIRSYPLANKWVEYSSGSNYILPDTIEVKGVRTNYIGTDTTSEAPYEIAVFPDIQNMIRYREAYSRSMFQWLADSADYYNIKALIQVGDITDWNTLEEWDTLQNQLGIFTSAQPDIPYIFVPGNHDYGNGFNPAFRDATNYNNNLGVAHYTGKPWYMGSMNGTTNENFWIKFDVGSRKYAVIGLEFIPRDSAVNWANNITDSLWQADPTREVMVVTHAHISQQGELATDTAVYSSNYYGMTADNSGQELWDKYLKLHPNIRWVFSGHFLIPDTWAKRGLQDRITSSGVNGNLVHQIFVNYQDDNNWGDGYFMRMKFYPDSSDVDIRFWSSYYLNDDTTNLGYSIDNPTIDIKTSIAVKGDVGVNGNFRVEGELKAVQLQKNRIPIVSSDHALITVDQAQVDTVLNHTTFRDEVLTDTLNAHIVRTRDSVYGRTSVIMGQQNTVLQVTQPFRGLPAGNGHTERTGVFIGTTIDSAHKTHFGSSLLISRNIQPVDGFPAAYPFGGATAFWPWRTNLQSSQRIFLKKVGNETTYTIGGTADFPNANVGFFFNHGAQEDSVHTTYGSDVLSGLMNLYVRQDLAPGSTQYSHANGMMTNVASYLKATRKANSEINWFNNFAVAGATGTDNGQMIKTFVGLYLEPQSFTSLRRVWGILQVGSSYHNSLNQLMIGDTTVANASGVKLYVTGGGRFIDDSIGAGKVMVDIDGNGTMGWRTPMAGGGSAVTSVATNDGTGITGGTITTTGTLAIDTANTIATIAQLQHRIDSLAATISGGSQTPWTSDINADGYTLYGNDGANEDMTIEGTSNATVATSYVNVAVAARALNIGVNTNSSDSKINAQAASGQPYVSVYRSSDGNPKMYLENSNQGRLWLASNNGDQDAMINFAGESNSRPHWFAGKTGGSPNSFQIGAYYPTGAYSEVYLNIVANGGPITLNSSGLDRDLQIKGDNDDNLIRTDAGNDRVGIGTDSPTAKFDINSDVFRVRVTKTPSSATDTGNAGDWCWDANYIYICTATNTWKRVALTTW